MHSVSAPLRVTVVGGGPAAAELLLALRALAGDRVELQLIAPDTELLVRAASPGAAFGRAVVERYDLAEVATETGASVRLDRVEAVAPAARRLRLASGGAAVYDELVVAVGARARVGVAGATTFRDQRDAHRIGGLLAGEAPRLAFAAPAGVAWTLPLYELALLTAAELSEREIRGEVVLVTPERRPLEVFGETVSEYVKDLLDERGVRLMLDLAPGEVIRDGLRLTDGSLLAVDRVIAVPRLMGRRIAGVPADWNAFIPTDEWGRVSGLEHVFAVGDVTAFPVKQGGLATQQADVVAALLAARAGAGVVPEASRPVLRTRLLGADEPTYLRAVLDERGRPVPGTSEVALREPPWWPGAKLVGSRLTPWMAVHH
jgi:sulfide:quinone oxidoreductase